MDGNQASSKFVPLKGSEKQLSSKTKIVSDADSNEDVQITITVRRGKDGQNADDGDIDKVKSFAEEFDLSMDDCDKQKRAIVVSGKIENICKAFQVNLKVAESPNIGQFRARTGSIYVPDGLKDIITSVLGLDDRPQAKPNFRILKKKVFIKPLKSTTKSFTPIELSQIYNFPKATGKNQTIAIIELGGGFYQKDIDAYLKKLGIKTKSKVVSIGIDGAKNKPENNPDGADGEVVLDIEVAAAIATDATIVVYFAPNTDRGFFDAISEAIHSKKYKPSAISISWGGIEESFTDQSKATYEEAFKDAARLGINVYCAAGDNGSNEGQNDGQAYVTFPSSAPHAISCGGTRLSAPNNKISSETVWNRLPSGGATGGGISNFFMIPDWQKAIMKVKSSNDGMIRRGVPDISAVADPETGYQISFYGKDYVIGGTSAVAPLLAAMNCVMNDNAGKSIGFILDKIYKLKFPNNSFHDITTGSNGAYKASKGWDACTGLGSPNATELLKSLS